MKPSELLDLHESILDEIRGLQSELARIAVGVCPPGPGCKLWLVRYPEREELREASQDEAVRSAFASALDGLGVIEVNGVRCTVEGDIE